MSPVLIGVLAYVFLQLAIGFAVSRGIRDEADYLLAGRSLGYGLATFSIFATWFGAETCIGAAGAIYERGLSGGSADPFGYALCLLFMGLFFARSLWRRRLTTLGDLFRTRYSPGIERIAVVFMVPSSIIWAAAQIRAFGQVLSATSSSEIGVTVAITIAAVVVIVYTISGGLLADAVTDLVQGVALIIGLVILACAVVDDLSDPVILQAAIDTERLHIFGGGKLSSLETLEAWAVPVCGSLVAQELVSRVLATRSPMVAQRASLLATVVYLLLGGIPVVIGLIGPSLYPDLEHAEQILPLVAQQQLSSFAYILFAGALVSAILSTVDSTLLAASALVSHNLIVSVVPGLSEATKIRVARIGVLVFGIIAYVLALYTEGIYHLVETASAFGGAGIFTLFIFGLCTRIGSAPSAFAALAVGSIVWIHGTYIVESSAPYVLSLVSAFAAYLIVAGASRALPSQRSNRSLP
ncbi:MAG: sodium:solute symporter family protein [Candidatus Binatia bacterium]